MVFPAVDPGLLLLAAVAARRDNRLLGLPGGTCDVGGDDLGGVPVQAAAGPVIPHRRPWIGVRGSFLDVTQRDPGIERGGNERMPECVRRDGLGDHSPAGDLAHDPSGTMPVQSPPVRA